MVTPSTSWPETRARRSLLEHAEVVRLVVEVSERGEEVDDQVKARRATEAPHILEDELHAQVRVLGACTCMIEEERCAVDRGNGKATLRERHRMPPGTATEIEHRAAAQPSEPQDLLHLFIGDRKGR